MRWDIINRIADIYGAKSYLEIGIGTKENLYKIKCQKKIGVDPLKSLRPDRCCTSDEFSGIIQKSSTSSSLTAFIIKHR